MKYDVVVIGAGPAGAMASKYASQNGASTLLVEEHASIGSPVQCTGLVSTAAIGECEVGEGGFILERMKGAFVYAPNCEELCIRGKDVKAYVIDRKMFDMTLVERSLDEGTDLLLRTRFTGLGKDKIWVRSNGEKKEIHADIIIGADGIQSSVGRAAGIARCKKFLSGIQFEAPYFPADSQFVEIFTGKDVASGFFAWAVPFGGMARIGLAKNPGDFPPAHYLEDLLHHPVVASRYRGSRTEQVLGGIPLGPPDKTIKGNVMLVGDAAGQVKPTSGGGVYMGAVCAKIAGEVAARASRKEASLEEYEKRWREAIGQELSIGMRIHKSIGKLGDEGLNEFIAYLNRPGIRESITEYGDMDHPSVLLRKLLNSGDKMKLMKLLGMAFKTLF
ncbi:MAG TPA: NAD(P)/FAD-dependent oxidoreductase [Candidatus Methanoperedens sp.]